MGQNLLSLEEWRKSIGYNPWHFWGLSGQKAPVNSSCNSVVKQYSWQGADSSGRAEIENAIVSAEQRIAPHLGFSPAPHYASAVLPYPRHPNPTIRRYGYAGSDGRWETLYLPEGKVIGMGIKALTTIGDANVTLSDLDGDGLKETFTVTIASTLTDASQIRVFFNSTDRYDGSAIGDTWEIRPVNVSISGGNIIVKGNTWLICKPVKYQGFSTDAIDPVVESNFASSLTIAREYLNPNGLTYDDAQAVLIWETSPYPSFATIFGDPASYAYAIARAGVRNAEQGIITIGEAIYDTTTGEWQAVPWYSSTNRWTPPDRVLVRYLAGEQRVNNQMEASMNGIVSRMACAELQQRICACDTANRSIYHWQFDLARSAGSNDEAYTMVSGEDLRNPLGTKRGQVYAWKDIQSRRIFRGFSI